MKKNLAKRMLLAVAGLLVGIAVSEVILRIHGAAAARRIPEKTFAPDNASADSIRMAVLGGSTAGGTPYSNFDGKPFGKDGFNLLSVAGFLLEQRLGSAPVHIDSYAGANWSAATTINHYFERPGPKPDVLVLYSGQNETTQYYSPNMKPPPAALAPLAHLQFGSLLLRRMYTRQVAPGDQRYSGKFFSDNIIPSYERDYSLLRFRRSVERLVRHAEAQGIFLLIVVPQSNYVFPPTRSVYQGPAARKAEALRLFKQAWAARHLDNQREHALALFEQIDAFCDFAGLSYELGLIHYERGDMDKALSYLRQARDTDGFPICITTPYRDVLLDIVDTYAVPHVDMDTLIRDSLQHAVPSYRAFLDDCHLHYLLYLELAREALTVMHAQGFDIPEPASRELTVSQEEWGNALGITGQVWLDSLMWEANYHANHSNFSYLKLGFCQS